MLENPIQHLKRVFSQDSFRAGVCTDRKEPNHLYGTW